MYKKIIRDVKKPELATLVKRPNYRRRQKCAKKEKSKKSSCRIVTCKRYFIDVTIVIWDDSISHMQWCTAYLRVPQFVIDHNQNNYLVCFLIWTVFEMLLLCATNKFYNIVKSHGIVLKWTWTKGKNMQHNTPFFNEESFFSHIKCKFLMTLHVSTGPLWKNVKKRYSESWPKWQQNGPPARKM